MGLQEQGWFFDILRSIFAFLDGLVFGLIKWILFGIFDLANLNTNSDIFGNIYGRIYVILGIFMAFKLSFSFFQYIIDPDSMSGKSDKGLGKLLSRVFIMLCALIFLPAVLFGTNGGDGILTRAQRAFLPSLPKLIFGVNDIGGLSGSYSTSSTGSSFSDSIEQSANDITVTTLKGFFYSPEDLDLVCGDGTIANSPEIESIDDFKSYVNLTCTKKGDIDIGIGSIHTGTRYYKYSYMPFISTVFGVLLAALLLGITLDIAKRIFKLMVLEAIAPVPIMSLIDPKASKDGAFGKWVKSLTSTFLDIFFKMGLVYLVIVFIHLIVNSGSSGGLFKNFPSDSGFRSVYLILLLILGLVFFAKEAPKFIKNALGIKSEGNGLFDDVKAVGKAAGLVGGAAVGTAGVFGSGVANYRASKEENKELHPGSKFNGVRNLGSGIAGAIGGGAVAAKALTGKNAGIKSVLDAQGKRNATRAAHSTLFGRGADNAYSMFTGRSLATRDQSILDANKAAADSIKSFKATSVDEAKKHGTFGSIDHKKFGDMFKNKGFNYNALIGAMEGKDSNGNFQYTYQVLDDGGNVVGTNTETFNAGTFANPNVLASLEDSQTDRYLKSEWGTRSDGTIGFKNDKINTDWRTAKHDMTEANITYSGQYLGQSSYGDIGKSIGKAKAKVMQMGTGMQNIKHRANKKK